jgi:nicotinamide mononucleotide transporter
MKLDAILLAELLGALTGLACVALLTRQKLASWPLGIVNNALYGGLFWHAKLYADASLQGVFLALAAYGWWLWSAQRGHAVLHVRRTTRREWGALSGLTVLATALVAAFLRDHRPAARAPGIRIRSLGRSPLRGSGA